MSIILNIETATEVCSICVTIDGLVITERSSASQNHATDIHLFIQQVLHEAGMKPQALNAVAVSSGPGSYTGLRIGWATAKGLAYALNIPLISVDTLQSLAYGLQLKYPNAAAYMPMIDARRMEIYTALYDDGLKNILPVQSLVIDEARPAIYNHAFIYGGNGAEKVRPYMPKNALYVDGLKASATNMTLLSYAKFLKNEVLDLAYSEPFYLKDARITTKIK